MTRRFIRIEGDLVNEIQEEVVSTSALRDFMPLLERRPAIHMPVAPTNTRAQYFDSSNTRSQRFIMMIEREPQIINMNFLGTVHRLSIPWSRFYFVATTTDPTRNAMWSLEDYRIFWAKTKYTDPAATDMIQALLPNIYDNAQICFGSTAANADQTLADRLDQTVNEFYVSNFNRDLTIRYPNGWRNWTAWETMTRDDPLGWSNWPDLDPARSAWSLQSWNALTLAAIPDRSVPVVSPDAIPALNVGATWGAAQEWWDGLTNTQRARLADIARQAPAHMLTVTA